MKIENFNPKNDKKAIDAVRTEINKALESVKNAYGFKKLLATNASYTPDGLTVNFKVEVEVDPAVSPEAKLSTLLGFNQNIIGEKFMNGPKEFTVSRLEPSRPKWPIIATDATGKAFKFQATKRIRWHKKEIEYKYDF